METNSEINALLRLYLEAGVDETIGSEPLNRFSSATNAGAAQVSAEKKSGRAQNPDAPKPVVSKPMPSLAAGIHEATDLAERCQTIDELRAALEKFDGCPLKRMATHTVFAEGSPEAKLMVIDRQPSVDEDRSGKPFAGEAGVLFAKMLAAIGIDREDVYLVSLLPWRPPGGRAPTEEELSLCLPFAMRHIALASPTHVLACGEAAGYLLKQKTGINKLRGKWTELQVEDNRSTILPIFHPAFLIDQPASKKYAWADLLTLKAAMEGHS
ncbi:MAG: uracil-DNA glycosylase [Sneathiella sp.]|nr:uracil-DNA glycosylase [Sneathiella sp.]